MIDLKSIIEKYPSCIDSPEKFRGFMLDLYPDNANQARIKVLTDILASGVVEKIKAGKISATDLHNYKQSIEQKYGYSETLITESILQWVRAFGQDEIPGVSDLKSDEKTSASPVKQGFFARLFRQKENNEVKKETVSEEQGRPIEGTVVEQSGELSQPSTDSNPPQFSKIHIHQYAKKSAAPTCQSTGYVLHKCSCGYEYKDTFTPMLSHRYELVDSTPATCTKEGRKNYLCSMCNDYKSETLPMISHNYQFHATLIPATCAQMGENEKVCIGCGKKITETVSKLNHQWSDWAEQIHTTCTTDGKYIRQCMICGETAEREEKAKGHMWSEWSASFDRFCCNCGVKETWSKSSVLLLKMVESGKVLFGRYPQDTDENDNTPIEWIPLKKENGKVLLISRYGLNVIPFNKEWEYITWEQSTICRWLNSEFYNQAFTAEEKQRILMTRVPAHKNPEYDTNPGNATEDKVFLLSIKEANALFSNDELRKCVPTEYAKKRGVYTSDEDTLGGKATCWWWLRSPGDDQYNAAFVDECGSVVTDGSFVDDDDVCARPALWVNLES